MEDCTQVVDCDGESDTDLDDIEDIDGISVPTRRSVTDDSNSCSSSSGKQVKTTCTSMRTVKKQGVTTSTVEKWKTDYDRIKQESLVGLREDGQRFCLRIKM